MAAGASIRGGARSASPSEVYGLTVTGELVIGARSLPLEIPVTVERLPDGSQALRGETTVTREAVGLKWNMMGAIGDDAVLHGRLTLERVSR